MATGRSSSVSHDAQRAGLSPCREPAPLLGPGHPGTACGCPPDEEPGNRAIHDGPVAPSLSGPPGMPAATGRGPVSASARTRPLKSNIFRAGSPTGLSGLGRGSHGRLRHPMQRGANGDKNAPLMVPDHWGPSSHRGFCGFLRRLFTCGHASMPTRKPLLPEPPSRKIIGLVDLLR